MTRLIFNKNIKESHSSYPRTLMTVNRTFINFLVLLDCLNSLGHLPTLIQFVLYVT